MLKNTKKILSLTLALIMILSLVAPNLVFAATSDIKEPTAEERVTSTRYDDSMLYWNFIDSYPFIDPNSGKLYQTVEPWYYSANGVTTYCLDLGKTNPPTSVLTYDKSNKIQFLVPVIRIVKNGYPYGNGKEIPQAIQVLGLTDQEQEWATALAIKIARIYAYHSFAEGNIKAGTTLDFFKRLYDSPDFDVEWNTYFTMSETGTANQDKANAVKSAVKYLIECAKNESIAVETFDINLQNSTSDLTLEYNQEDKMYEADAKFTVNFDGKDQHPSARLKVKLDLPGGVTGGVDGYEPNDGEYYTVDNTDGFTVNIISSKPIDAQSVQVTAYVMDGSNPLNVPAQVAYITNETPPIVKEGQIPAYQAMYICTDTTLYDTASISLKTKTPTLNITLEKHAKEDAEKETPYGPALPGVVFDLYALGDDGNVQGNRLAQARTNDQGKISFQGLKIGKYRLVEVTPYNGYRPLANQDFEFKIDETTGKPTVVFGFDEDPENPTGQMTGTFSDMINGTIRFPNYPVKITFNKVDGEVEGDEKPLLPGAKFHYEYSKTGAEGTYKNVEELTWDEVTIPELKPSFTWDSEAATGTATRLIDGYYKFVEDEAPEGYAVRPAKEFYVKNGILLYDGQQFNGPLTVTYQNKKAPEKEPINITFMKVDENNESLAGAVFHLEYSKTENGNYTDFSRVQWTGFDADKVPTFTWNKDTGLGGLSNVQDGYYRLVEDSAPDGYLKMEPEEFSMVNGKLVYDGQERAGSLVLELINRKEPTPENPKADVTILKTSSVGSAPVVGAVIKVTDSNGTEVEGSPFTTNAEGKIVVKGLVEGTYTYVETASPEGYILDETPHTFTVDSQGKASGELAFTNVPVTPPPEVDVTLLKVSSEDEAPVEGAVVKVTDATGKEVAGSPFTTDAKGNITIKELTPGTYTFVETKAPAGFVLNSTPYTFTVTDEGDITGTTKFTNTPKPEDVYSDVVLLKTDSLDGKPVAGAVIKVTNEIGNQVKGSPFTTDAEGKVTIEGLPVGTYTYEEISTPAGYVSDGKTYTFTIDEDGEVSGTTEFTNTPTEVVLTKTDLVSDAPVPGATIEIRTKGGDVVATEVTGEDGKITLHKLPAGTYVFHETVAPDGYILNEEEVEFTIGADGKVTGKTTLTDAPNSIIITKTDIVSGDVVPGATIEILDSEGNQIEGSPFVTGEDGKIKLEKLPVGEYTFRETVAPDGYILNKEEAKFSVDEYGEVTGTLVLTNKPTEVTLTKTDLVDGSPVPGATIEILDSEGNVVDTQVTGEDGKITLRRLPAGTYTFHETVAPDGYILSDEKAEFTINADGVVSGKTTLANAQNEVVITKTDLVDGTPVPGATIEIRDANGKQIAGSPFTTDDNGKITLKKLPAGSYTFKEIVAPNGYVLNQEECKFAVDEYGKVTGKTTLTNTPNEVVLHKIDRDANTPLKGAKFEIRRDNVLVATEVTGEDGTITLKKLLSGTYTVKEIEAPAGYKLENTVYTFTVGADGKVSGTTTISNAKIVVELYKKDITTGDVLEGATFVIKTESGATIATATTGAAGKIIISKLPAGKYSVQETVAPQGYELNNTVYTFTVKENGEVEGTTTIYDKKSPTGTPTPTPGTPTSQTTTTESTTSETPTSGTPTTNTNTSTTQTNTPVKTGEALRQNGFVFLLAGVAVIAVAGIAVVVAKKKGKKDDNK